MGFKNLEDGSCLLDKAGAEEVANLLLDAAELVDVIQRVLERYPEVVTKLRLAAAVVMPFPEEEPGEPA